MCVCDMMDDIMEDKSEIHDNATDFLPDLTEGKTFDQICFDQKVNKANEKFVRELPYKEFVIFNLKLKDPQLQVNSFIKSNFP